MIGHTFWAGHPAETVFTLLERTRAGRPVALMTGTAGHGATMFTTNCIWFEAQFAKVTAADERCWTVHHVVMFVIVLQVDVVGEGIGSVEHGASVSPKVEDHQANIQRGQESILHQVAFPIAAGVLVETDKLDEP